MKKITKQGLKKPNPSNTIDHIIIGRFLKELEQESALLINEIEQDLQKKSEYRRYSPEEITEMANNNMNIACLHDVVRNYTNIGQVMDHLYNWIQSYQAHFSGQWITKLVEIQFGLQIGLVGKKGYSNLASWMIKEINTHADQYHIKAYLNKLNSIWLKGGLNKEVKEMVKITMEEHGRTLARYSVFSPASIKVMSN